MNFSISNKKRSRQMSASVYSINKKAIVKDPSSKSQVLSLSIRAQKTPSDEITIFLVM